MAGEIIGVFSEDQAANLTGVSKRQLGYWDRTDFFHPSYTDDEPGTPFKRLYTFRDLIELRVLNQLRNEYQVPMKHLRDVRKKLSTLPESRWASQRLWVVNRDVVWRNPRMGIKEGVTTKQGVLDYSLRVVITGMHHKIKEMNNRGPEEHGKIVKNRYIGKNQPVIAGTRISVDTIKSFAEAGYSEAAILKEYPTLTVADVKAAVAYDPFMSDSAAA
jgi:uncharacterized protein (DUF433 family)